MKNWDEWFLDLADFVAARSKDPSTKVGAVITRGDHTVASFGFNGLPRGVADTEERLNDRELKYKLVVHAELNAILSLREPIQPDYMMYCSLPPCSNCAAAMINAGIRNVTVDGSIDVPDRWLENMTLARQILEEAGVKCYAI